jgi:uncharacterized membrane protein
MAFCSRCGSEVQGKFCAQCGAPTGSPPPAPMAPPPSMSSSAGLEENMASALCYVLGLLTGVLFLVLEPYNRNRTIRFHAFQSIFLHVGVIAVYIGIAIVVGIFHIVPFLGTFFGLILYPIISFGFLILWLTVMYKTYNRERWVLPIIGELAEKQV